MRRRLALAAAALAVTAACGSTTVTEHSNDTGVCYVAENRVGAPRGISCVATTMPSLPPPASDQDD